MRRFILYIAASLDGYIASVDGDIGFLSPMQKPGEDYGYTDFLRGIDTVVLGRKTYEKVLSFGIASPYPKKRVIVLSRSQTGITGSVEYYAGSLVELAKSLRSSEGEDVYIDGGSEVVSAMRAHDLIDRYIVSIIPVLLGNGIPLFRSHPNPESLQLVKSQAYPSGLVQLWYDRVAV